MEKVDENKGEKFLQKEEVNKPNASVVQHLRRWPSIDKNHYSCQRLLHQTLNKNGLEEGGGDTPQLVSADNVEGLKVI